MDQNLLAIQNKYASLLLENGDTPEGLCQGRGGKPHIRYEALAGHILQSPDASLLDYGCGTGGLYGFLRERGWRGKYVGVDITPQAIAFAKTKFPEADFRVADLSDFGGQNAMFDMCVAIGAFSMKTGHQDTGAFYRACTQRLFELSRVALSVDFMSTYVDFQKDIAWHAKPEEMFSFAKTLSPRVLLRHDYLPYEFCMVLWHTSISDDNLFV